jgi:PAS domain S-box-containing protein
MSDDDRFVRPPELAGTTADDEALWAIFSESRNPMLLADDRRRYVNANTAACVFLGYDLGTLRTMRIDDLAIPETRPFLDDVWDDFLARGGSVGRFALLRSDGTPVEVEFNATANVVPGLHLSLFINPAVTGEGQGLDDVGDDAMDDLQEPVSAVTARSGSLLDGVERRVMTLLALGLNWHEVADDLGVSPSEVRALMQSAMEKLGGRTRAHAVSIAIRAGEIDPADPAFR